VDARELTGSTARIKLIEDGTTVLNTMDLDMSSLGTGTTSWMNPIFAMYTSSGYKNFSADAFYAAFASTRK
jgi:hypothetical protein